MRNSLMRLSSAFAKEGDTLKAIEILDLSLDKMPIKDFDHFSLSLEYPEMYYQLGEVDKARKTAETLIRLFKEKLIWHSTFAKRDFDLVFEDFDLTFRYLYRGVLEQVQESDPDFDYFEKLQNEFNATLDLFQHIMPEEETTPEDLELLED
jgi:tetratricopeptide (TPR) repeat protein